MQPLTVHSLPIYYGNPRVCEDFTPECMVTVSSCADLERAIDEVISLDKDDEAYLAKVTAPCLVHPVAWYDERLEDFLRNIVEQPYEQAKRRVRLGFQPVLRSRIRHLWAVDDAWKAPLRAARQFWGFWR